MRLFLLFAACALVGLGFWYITTPKVKPIWLRDVKERSSASKASRAQAKQEENLLLWLSGLPLSKSTLMIAQVCGCAIGALVGYFATSNVVIAGMLGYIGWYSPMSFISNQAAKKWQKADDSAYTLANVLRFSLALKGHPAQAIRDALSGMEEPLKGWLAHSLALEAAGEPVEETLYNIGLRLRNQEIMLLAEILKADRRSSPSHHLLPNLLDAWTERIRSSQQRRAKLGMAQKFSAIVIWVPVVGFLAVMAFTGAGSVLKTSFAGQAVATLGMGFMFLAAYIARTALAQERGPPTK